MHQKKNVITRNSTSFEKTVSFACLDFSNFSFKTGEVHFSIKGKCFLEMYGFMGFYCIRKVTVQKLMSCLKKWRETPSHSP